MKLNLKESLDFPFADPEWPKKLTVVGLCSLFPFTAPQSIGYTLDVIRSTADGEDSRLPSLRSWSRQWLEGFWLLLIGCFAVLIMASGVAATTMAVLPYVETDPMIFLLSTLVVVLVTLFLLLVLGTLAPALLLRYALQRTVSSLFDVTTAMSDIKQGPGDYTLLSSVPLIGGLATLVFSGTLIGLLAVPLISAATLVVQGKMLGDYYRAYFD